jgi:hypothetical protein
MLFVIKSILHLEKSLEQHKKKRFTPLLAPLDGDYFVADARRVHQIIKTYTQGESAEEWIRTLHQYQDGCIEIYLLSRLTSKEKET